MKSNIKDLIKKAKTTNSLSIENEFIDDDLWNEISKLTNLKEIYLKNTKLNEFPKQILNLTKLKKIDLSNNQIEKIPEEISNLKQIETFEISFNKLENIQKKIFELPKLIKIDIFANNIKTLPVELFYAKNLVKIIYRGKPFCDALNFLYSIEKKYNHLFYIFISLVKEKNNADLFNLKKNNYKIIFQENFIFIKDKQNHAIIYITDDNELKYFFLHVFGKEETQKKFLLVLRKKIETWLLNTNKKFLNNSYKNYFGKKIAERYFYYPIQEDFMEYIDFDWLIENKQDKNIYKDKYSEKKIPITDLLEYIGAENEEISSNWNGTDYITNIKIENFKIFTEIKCNLSEHINILIGKNGLGKTSFLQALTLGLLPDNNVDKSNKFQNFISYKKQKSDITINWGIEERKTYIFKNEKSVEQAIVLPNKLILSYGVNLNTDEKLSHREIINNLIIGDDNPYSTESIFKDYSTNFYDPIVLFEMLILEREKRNTKLINSIIKLIRNTLDKYLNLFLEPEKICLHVDANNPAFYFYKDINQTELTTADLSEGYKDYILQITDIIVRIIAGRNSIFENKNIEISEKLFNQVKGVIIIDEFDRHLHPEIQRKLLFQLKKDFQNIQFVLTTHNVFSVQSAVGAMAHKIFSKDNKIQIESEKIEAKNILAIIRKYFTKNTFDKETQEQLNNFNENLNFIYEGDEKLPYSAKFHNQIKQLTFKNEELNQIIANDLIQLNYHLEKKGLKQIELKND